MARRRALGRDKGGRAIFVRHPRRRRCASRADDRRGFARAAGLEVFPASSDRVTRAAAISASGNCHFRQHMTYAAQLRAKDDATVISLIARGGLKIRPPGGASCQCRQ